MPLAPNDDGESLLLDDRDPDPDVRDLAMPAEEIGS
jgi:hypothetical protein